MAKWQTGKGTVVGMDYVGPPGAPWYHWTSIVVDLDGGERISALLRPKDAKKSLIAVGDQITLDYQPGQQAGMGFLGRIKGLCRKVEVRRGVTP